MLTLLPTADPSKEADCHVVLCLQQEPIRCVRSWLAAVAAVAAIAGSFLGFLDFLGFTCLQTQTKLSRVNLVIVCTTLGESRQGSGQHSSLRLGPLTLRCRRHRFDPTSTY